MSEGKIQLNGGFGALYDDGKTIIHDTNNTSCCCGTDPPWEACKEVYWKDYGLGVPPAGALFPEDISENKIPRCIQVTIQGGAFDGEYQLYWYGNAFFGRFAIIAQENQQFNSFALNIGGSVNFDKKVAAAALYVGHQYEVVLRAYLDSEGAVKGSLSIESLGNEGAEDRLMPFNSVVYYTNPLGFFDQAGSIKLLYPTESIGGSTAILPDDLGEGWLMSANFMNFGSGVRRGWHDEHKCECFHNRFINSSDQRVTAGQNNALDSTWHGFRRLLQGTGETGIYSRQNMPLEATGFQDIPSISILSGSGAAASLRGDNELNAEPLIARRYFPMVRGQGWVWECTFNTAVFLRNGTAALPNSGDVGGFTGSYVMNVPLPFAFDRYLKLTRFLQVRRNTFGSNPTTDMEALSYWTCNFAAAHTETVPTADSILAPNDICLPSTTTLKFVWDWLDYKCVDVGFVGRPEYRYSVYVNGSLVASGIYCSDAYELFWKPEGRGRGQIDLTVNNSSVWVNRPTSIWSQFPEGFDNDVKGGLISTSFYPTNLAPYYAPEYCPSVPPKILMTAQGTVNDVNHSHSITFHLGEDIGTHKMYDANGYMQGRLLIKGFPDSSGVPPGLSLSDDGVLSGTPTTRGSWSLYRLVLDEVGQECFSWTLSIVVKVRNPEFQYDPQGFTSGGTNDQGVDWYMRDGDSGTIEADAHWGTTPYVMSYTGDALDGASFNTSTGDWVLNPAHTQVGNTSGTVTMKLLDDTNKTNYVTKTWFRLGGGGGGGMSAP